jgi:MFS family permease
MAVGGLGSGFTFSSVPALMVPHLPRSETGSAMAFNQVLRYAGFSVGSASSVALMTVYGGGPSETGFRGALLTTSAVWVVAALASTVLARRVPRAT